MTSNVNNLHNNQLNNVSLPPEVSTPAAGATDDVKLKAQRQHELEKEAIDYIPKEKPSLHADMGPEELLQLQADMISEKHGVSLACALLAHDHKVMSEIIDRMGR